MSETITASFNDLMRQASMTTMEYVDKLSYDIKLKWPDLPLVEHARIVAQLSQVASIDYASAVLTQALQQHTRVLERIGFGDQCQDGQGPLEAIAMALAGNGLREPLGPCINSLASSIGEIASAIETQDA